MQRGGSQMLVTGLDDLVKFQTDSAADALQSSPDGFKIAIVHSPHGAEQAAQCGYALYLTGHTHGGQICLPGGMPIFTGMHGHRAFASDLWHCNGMTGYTTNGVGVSGSPVRFNSRGEVA